MSAEVELAGAFTNEEQLVHCIGELRAARTRFRVYSPITQNNSLRMLRIIARPFVALLCRVLRC